MSYKNILIITATAIVAAVALYYFISSSSFGADQISNNEYKELFAKDKAKREKERDARENDRLREIEERKREREKRENAWKESIEKSRKREIEKEREREEERRKKEKEKIKESNKESSSAKDLLEDITGYINSTVGMMCRGPNFDMTGWPKSMGFRTAKECANLCSYDKDCTGFDLARQNSDGKFDCYLFGNNSIIPEQGASDAQCYIKSDIANKFNRFSRKYKENNLGLETDVRNCVYDKQESACSRGIETANNLRNELSSMFRKYDKEAINNMTIKGKRISDSIANMSNYLYSYGVQMKYRLYPNHAIHGEDLFFSDPPNVYEAGMGWVEHNQNISLEKAMEICNFKQDCGGILRHNFINKYFFKNSNAKKKALENNWTTKDDDTWSFFLKK